jgi:AcrR family transcriptional regulator
MKKTAIPRRRMSAYADGPEPDSKGTETRERIIAAAEDLLRKHGIAKTTVVDVARALEMSHANVYRHFASKSELQDAVAERWLKRIMTPLRAIVAEEGDAAERLERWVLTLAAQKRAKVLNDPELFEAYHAIAQDARAVVEAHVAELRKHIAGIIRDGVAQGTFKVKNADTAAAAVLNATSRFHHPYHVKESGGRDTTTEIKAVLQLVRAGLGAGTL